MRWAWVLMLAVGCVADTGGLDLEPGDSSEDAGPPDRGIVDTGPLVCCADFGCHLCNGGFHPIGGCGEEWCEPPFPEPLVCPPPVDCLDCSTFSEESCPTDEEQNCRVRTCPDFNGDPTFAACTAQHETVSCEVWGQCPNFGEQDCIDALECHGVYQDEPVCDCAEPGCCMQFVACRPNAVANCGPQEVTCRRAEPICGEGFVISYVDECYEGCAREEACAQ